MIKLGKKNEEILETIEAYSCSGLKVCKCSDDDDQHYSKNDNIFWKEWVRH